MIRFEGPISIYIINQKSVGFFHGQANDEPSIEEKGGDSAVSAGSSIILAREVEEYTLDAGGGCGPDDDGFLTKGTVSW